MNNIIVDVLPIALLLVFVFGLHPVKPLSAINQDYLSIYTGKYYRGLFALVILFHHLAQRTKTGVSFRFFTLVGYLAVAAFFFFSGYGLQKSYMNKTEKYKKKFLLRRLPSVLIPYIIVTVLYWMMYRVGGQFYSLKDIMVAIINGKPIVMFSWYIINILIFYIAFWLLMLVCKKHYFAMILGSCLWYLLYVVFCIKMDYCSYWYNASQLLVVGMFWAVYEVKITDILKKYYAIIAPVTWLLFIVLCCFSGKIEALIPLKGISLFLSMLTAVIFVLSVLLFSLKIVIGNKILGFLGNISLEIYLVQGLFIMGFRNSKIYIQNEFLWCVAVLAATIIFAYILRMFFSALLTRYRKLIK